MSLRLSYPGSLDENKIGNSGAGAVAAAAGTMLCLEELRWVLVHSLFFYLFHIIRFLSLKGTSWRTERDRQTQGHELYVFKGSEIAAQSPFLI